MATLTAQMTFCNPAMTPMVMDAITQGWQLGRNAKNLNFIRWEERLGEPIDDLRREFAIPSGLAEALAA